VKQTSSTISRDQRQLYLPPVLIIVAHQKDWVLAEADTLANGNTEETF